MMLHILGMNGPFPAAGGACSGYLVTAGNRRIVMDMGAGTLMRLSALTDPCRVDALLMSHFHHDHASDLGVLSYMLAARGEKIRVLAPERASAIEGNMFIYDEATETMVGDVKVESMAVRHPVPARAYKLTHEGRTLVYTGDTNTVDGLEAFCENADVLLCDACLPFEKWDESAPHLSAKHAGELARNANVKQLILTHMNPALVSSKLVSEARDIFANTILAKQGTGHEI